MTIKTSKWMIVGLIAVLSSCSATLLSAPASTGSPPSSLPAGSAPQTGDQMSELIIPSQTINGPAPLTGLVLWSDNENMATYKSVVSLEFKYFYYSDVVSAHDPVLGYQYNWQAVKEFLSAARARGHLGIVRFRDTDPELPADQTTLPPNLNNFASAKYNEGIEGAQPKVVRFPDWRNVQLKSFIIDFYQHMALEFDGKHLGLAYFQVGFGLWGEYHLDYDNLSDFSDPAAKTLTGAIGVLFPAKLDQKSILTAIGAAFKSIPWSISIDAANSDYSCFSDSDPTAGLNFGLFDDSVLSADWESWNQSQWQFFGIQSLSHANGGEISYYTDNDQAKALDAAGPNGLSLAALAARCSLSYVIGNDQPKQKRSVDEIAHASRQLGYKLSIVSARSNATNTEIIIKNTGVAGVFYDIYPAMGQTKSSVSLRGLLPGQSKLINMSAGGLTGASFRLTSPELTVDQVIPFCGNGSSL